MSEDRILNFVGWRLDDKTGFHTYSSGKKDDFYDIFEWKYLLKFES